jgi:hypothetical protein
MRRTFKSLMSGIEPPELIHIEEALTTRGNILQNIAKSSVTGTTERVGYRMLGSCRCKRSISCT